jgi:hypothetical protein
MRQGVACVCFWIVLVLHGCAFKRSDFVCGSNGTAVEPPSKSGQTLGTVLNVAGRRGATVASW